MTKAGPGVFFIVFKSQISKRNCGKIRRKNTAKYGKEKSGKNIARRSAVTMTKVGPGVCDSSRKERKLTMKTGINMISILTNFIRITREVVKKRKIQLRGA